MAWTKVTKSADGFTKIDKLPTIAGDWFVGDWFVLGWFVGTTSWDTLPKIITNWTII